MPVYRRIADEIVRAIGSGELPEGARLPPEREMAASRGVAVGTVRHALELLVEQGLVERRHGSGNYVRGIRDTGGLYGFFRLERRDGGGRPGARAVSVERVRDGWRIRRLRLLDELPVAVEDITVRSTAEVTLTADMLEPALYRTYREILGLRIDRVEDRCGIGILPDWAARMLGMDAGTCVGHVARRSWSGSAEPVETSDTWFDSDKAAYVSRMK